MTNLFAVSQGFEDGDGHALATAQWVPGCLGVIPEILGLGAHPKQTYDLDLNQLCNSGKWWFVEIPDWTCSIHGVTVTGSKVYPTYHVPPPHFSVEDPFFFSNQIEQDPKCFLPLKAVVVKEFPPPRWRIFDQVELTFIIHINFEELEPDP